MTSSLLILAFGFGSLSMLGWLAAAAVPLVIHLWSRRRYREIPWAAIEFLLAAMRKNARRIRIEQLLLLAVRMSLVALLVFALAEPYLEQVGLQFVAGERTHRVLVIDGSFSMDYRPADRSLFDQAKALAARIVDESTQGDGFTLIEMADPPRVVVGTPAFEAADFVEEIENLKLVHGGANVAATLAKVEEILKRAEKEHPRLARNEVYFLSDMQQVSWKTEAGNKRSAKAFLRQSKKLSGRAALVVIDVGEDDRDNLALASLSPSDPFVTVARDVTFEAEVRNFGRQPRPNQLIEMFVDGNRAGEEHVRIEAGGRATVTFAYRFDSGGDHSIEFRTAGDPLDIDDHRWLSLPIKEAVRALCINGKPEGGSFRDATDYLAVALSPLADVDRALIRPEVFPESALLELDLDRYDCIFLCNVAQFTASEASVLDAYLQNGGGLIFFMGDQVRPESYNRQLAGGNVRVLPARLAEVVPQGTYWFDPLDYQHPIISPFRGQEQAGLLTTPVNRYVRLELPEKSDARVALAFTNGDPAIVEEPIHRGRSVLVATSADVSWTPMPVWPSYVPIVQELVSAAVSGQLDERNLQVGQTLGASLQTLVSDIPITVTPPTGEAETVRLISEGDASRWTYSKTQTSGIYVAELGSPFSRRDMFAVNVDTTESDLTKVTPEEMRDDVWPGVDFTLQTSWQDVDEPPAAELTGQGKLHRWLLYGVLALLFCETFLAWQFGHHRT